MIYDLRFTIAAVKKMVIGVGDRKNPKPGGTGRIYIDDIRLTKRMPWNETADEWG